MASERGPRARSWRRGLSGADWSENERRIAALLDALTTNLVAAELTEVEMNARARRSPADVEGEQERIARDEREEARGELAAFADALRDARRRSGENGRGEVSFDPAQPVQNEQADLLIHYLVRPGYAEVRTEERAPDQHVYYLTVDWDRLEALSVEQGHPLTL
jgi:hypothetical protein